MNVKNGTAGRGGVGGTNDFGGWLSKGEIGVVGRWRVDIAIVGARDATTRSKAGVAIVGRR